MQLPATSLVKSRHPFGVLIEAGDPVAVSAIRTSNAGQAFEGFYRPR
ncbi:hypothetical protein LX14_000004 [Williamsia deligens]|nr:hypothetical protein [Williamsia deligens]